MRPRKRILARALGVACLAALVLASRGAVGQAGGWNLYLEYTFPAESHAIRDADRTKARRVADYLATDGTLRVGLDGMHRARIESVRDALVHAGVAPSRIESGAFGAPGMRGERRVLVMVGR